MISSLLSLLITLLVVGLIGWLVMFVVQQLPLGEPFAHVARVLVIVIFALIAIVLLLQFLGLVTPLRVGQL